MCRLWCCNHHGYSVIEDDFIQNVDGEDNFSCQGYKKNTFKTISFHFFAILLGGTPYLVLHWYHQLKASLLYSSCSLEEADVVLLKDSQNECSLVNVSSSTINFSGNTNTTVRFFHYRLLKYVWNDSLRKFILLKGLDDGETRLCDLLDKNEGYCEVEQAQLSEYYGRNHIIVEVKSYWKLLIDEVFNPFYIFQIWSIILWSLDNYYYYAGCVLFLCCLSIGTSLYQTKRQSLALNELVSASASYTVNILRKNGMQEEVNASHVVPGDIIILPPHGCMMGCDAVLLSGSCIVNESMLTGESVPVTKTPPPHSSTKYDVELHKRFTLFCGTEVLQTRFYENELVKAVVIRVGYLTSKGELVRSILFPKPMGFKFYADSIKFVLMLFGTAVLGMTFCIYLYVSRHADVETILLRTLDIVTIVVPPALPAAMTAGTVYSQNRLSKLGIFCISPPRINVCGKVKLVAFDKTGTLTEDGLEFSSVIPVENGQFGDNIQDVSEIPVPSPVVAALACCHSLTQIDGDLRGDPLDLSMFLATQWVLEEPGCDTTKYDTLFPTIVRPPAVKPWESDDLDKLSVLGGLLEVPYEIGIVRQFPFTSTAQRMSVITRDLGSSHMRLFCKGAPEKVIGMCIESTVPSNFGFVLSNYASLGYRVLALAYRNLDHTVSWRQAQRVKREQIEVEMTFIGLLIMQNKLKTETTPVIKQLQKASIRCLMVTGDNILTAVSVARNCGMIPQEDIVVNLKITASEEHPVGQIDYEFLGTVKENETSDHFEMPVDFDWHYAIDGRTWAHIRNHFPELVPQVVTKGTVFARMAPDQKSQLIESLQELDYVVAMVGDGANDCGALKTAHVGVSLSEAEASVAAPFTSRACNIQCIVHLLCEGRCALVTSFGVFKYMALYSLIQFISVLILYKHGSILSDMQFLYIDLVITTILAVVMGRTEPSSALVVKRPIGSLLALNNMIPLILQLVLVFIIQVTSLIYLKYQIWYKPSSPKDDELILCWENTVIFCVSCFQYLILATVYSKGRPHRKPFYSNVLFLGALIVLTLFTTFLLLCPLEPLASFFELQPPSEDSVRFRFMLMLFPLIHMVLACCIEMCVAETKWLKVLLHWLFQKRKPKNKYKCIMEEFKRNPARGLQFVNLCA